MSDTAAYYRPSTLEAACAVLAQGAHRIAAGCTDLFPATERKELPGPILDISAIKGLRGIRRDAWGLRIGATTTWTDLLHADLPPALRGLKQAAAEVGGIQIQNRGTLAGNLCNASPAADGVPPLLTLDAAVEIADARGTHSLPLAAFLTGPRRTALTPDQIVTAILIPEAALQGEANFTKLGARKYLVISIAMAAARLVITDGIVTEAALAVGACGPVATRITAAERALIGHPPDPGRIRDDDVAAALAPIEDIRADAAYRAGSAGTLLRRCVDALQS